MGIFLDRTSHFTYNNLSAGFCAVDFWEWFSSHSLDSATRGGIAEFIVMMSLGQLQERNIWEPFDLVYNGFRLEIKSASLFTCKSKMQEQYVYTPNSRIVFDISPHHRHISGGNWTERKRHSDFYVFCLLKDTDACILENWDFYVAKTADLNSLFNEQKTLSLSAIKQQSFPLCCFGSLKNTIDYLITGGVILENVKPVIELLLHRDEDQETFVFELQRLLQCYQLASRDDRNVVWAALNKYAAEIDKISPE